MRKTMVAASLAALVGGAALTARAQQGPMGNMRAMQQGQEGPHDQERAGMHRWQERTRSMALIFPAENRRLAGPDVQRIAEAFLLWNGNHTWKVTEVAEEPERVVFAFATPDNTVIARFAMDRRTGRPSRLS